MTMPQTMEGSYRDVGRVMRNGMQITVRYFAALREEKGREQESVGVEDGTDVSGLYQQLFAASPLSKLRVMFAVNQDYVGAGHALSDGDEVAFIPPLGGG